LILYYSSDCNNFFGDDEYETSSLSGENDLASDVDVDEGEEERSLSSLNITPSFRLKSSKSSVREDSPLPLLKSLFSNKPPTLYFTTSDEQGL